MITKKRKVILIMIFLTGLAILLYPFISQYWNSLVQSRAIANYDAMLSQRDSIDYEQMFQEANLYNEELFGLEFPLLQHKAIAGYTDLLNIDNHGMMGYITIDKIQIKLPIYHGTSSAILNTAVGHLNGTSLPVGGENTHSVLSAHSGLPSAKLFTNLSKLEIGDTFVITVLDRELTYQIDQILIVDPTDVSALEIEEGHDYVTLITCTPYGINTHRLLVRGTRISDTTQIEKIITADAELMDKFVVTLVIAIPVFIILMIYVMIKPVSKKKDEEEEI